MKQTLRPRALPFEVVAKSYLVVTLMIAACPLAIVFSRGRLTPFNTFAIAASLINLILVLAYWKPMVAYFGATSRARFEHNITKSMTQRAVQLRDTMRAQKAARDAADNPISRANAYWALEVTLNELETLVETLEPRHQLVGQIIAEAEALGEQFPHRRAVAWARRSLVSGLTGFAVAVAGERGAHLRDTWMADLAGAPEEGLVLSRWQQVGHAAGFVIAGIRIRGRALTEPFWRPVDWLLESDSRTRTTITLAVGAQVIYIVKHDGMHGLLTDGWGWCGGCALALHLFFRWLRRLRGIELEIVAAGSTED